MRTGIFYERHKTVRFDTLTETAEYEVIAVFKTTVYDDTGFKFYLFSHAETEKEVHGLCGAVQGTCPL